MSQSVRCFSRNLALDYHIGRISEGEYQFQLDSIARKSQDYQDRLNKMIIRLERLLQSARKFAGKEGRK